MITETSLLNIYTFNLWVIFIAALIARVLAKKDSSAYTGYKPNIMLTFLILTYLVLFSGLRYYVCGDEPRYRALYLQFGRDPSSAFEFKDLGFGIACLLLNKISADPQILIFAAALITNLLVMISLYKYADPFELAVFLYMTADLYYISFNGIRQILAGAIIFWSVKYLISNNWKKYFLFIVLASTFHLTALIFIPIYFIVRRKAWSLLTFMIIGATLLSFLFFGDVILAILELLEGSQYADYRGIITGTESVSVSITRVLVVIIPLVLAFLNDRKLRNKWKDSNIFVNLSLFSFVFMFLGLKHPFIARMCLYFNFYLIILLAKLTRIFDQTFNRVLYIIIIICYFLFSSVIIINGWGAYYRSIL